MRWALVKIFRGAVTMWLVVTFVFFVLRVSGDPTDYLVPDDAEEFVRDYYRAKFGLDRPLWEQYVNYWVAISQGDFGISFSSNLPALEVVWSRVPKTALLGVTSLGLGLGLGMVLGVLAAVYKDSWIDRAVMAVAVFGFSMPNFFLGILLILIFSLQLRVLPSSGSGTWSHLVMPAFTLGTAFAASIARFTRAAMLDVLSKPYMRTARSKGAGPGRRISAHALPNAAVPVVTILGFSIGGLLGGAVVTETVFAWPGIGRLLVNAVAERDLAIVQCIMILLAFTMVLANMIIDLLYGWLDPRVRVGAGTAGR